MVRTAVLKGKDPLKLLQEMEIIDQMGMCVNTLQHYVHHTDLD